MTSTKVSKPFTNWYVLVSFAVLAGISQMLWLNFAPLISYLKSHYEVTESDINWLLIVFPLIYILLSIHAGKVIDRRGYRVSILIGGLFMSVFSCIRIFDSSFSFLLIGQIGIAIGQPYILNAISSLVVDWFPKNKQATATGIGTVGMFIGMAIALAVTPLLVDLFGFQLTLVIMAILTILATLIFYFIGHHNTDFKRTASSSFSTTFKLLKNKNLLLLNIVSFLGLGVFNGLTSWLEQILKPFGISSEQAGIVGGSLIIGGIIGSTIIPFFSDKIGKRKPFLLFTIIGSLLLIYPVCTSGNFTFLLVLGSVLGFIFLPAFALLLSSTEELVGETVSGEATGLLLMAGNLGAVIVIDAMQFIKGEQSTWNHSVFFMLILLLIGFFLMLLFKEKAYDARENKLKN
ncbi:nitrate/nitrite transporter [Bacillus sp. AFS017336]|uniref:MFS transporter n=1 Tax=Bacillus sp. AFS017336 TaxID=2033489 RepID=UPI000BF1075A|nr:MFS transporter [Bacillus sp. AFS017336]PEL12321.1 MFS transporter [Bacillus sp. AFS017336]